MVVEQGFREGFGIQPPTDLSLLEGFSDLTAAAKPS